MEAIATDLVLIAGGRLVTRAPADELLRQTAGKVWEWTVSAAEFAALRQRHIVGYAIRSADGVRVRVIAAERPSATAAVVPPSLKEAYLHLAAGRKEAQRA